MPFMKVDEEKQMLYADTPFVKGEFYYVELEQGLWIMSSVMDYKNNVSYKPVYDQMLPADYYCISINIVENEFMSSFYEFDNYKVESHSISFLKPKKDFLNCHFKGSHEKMYMVYFDKNWLKKNILNSPNLNPATESLFSNDEIGYMNYRYSGIAFESLIENLPKILHESPMPNLLELKKIAYDFFEMFIQSLEERKKLPSDKVVGKDQIMIEKIEHFLMGNLYSKFPGIESLSLQFKISPTRLKQNFKIVYGMPIFKYFQKKQMELAFHRLKDEDLMVKEVAQLFGYENKSKFSSTFQNQHGLLPSAVRNK